MRAILFISFLFISEILLAQNFNINLSENHLRKLETYKSGHKRLKQYYKFYRKDSLDLSSAQRKKYKRELDSISRAEIKQEKLRRRLFRQGLKLPDAGSVYVDNLDREVKRYLNMINDSSTSDSVRTFARIKVKQLAVEKAKLTREYQTTVERYLAGDSLTWEKVTEDIPGLDTLSDLFNSSPDEFFATVEHSAEDGLKRATGGTLFGDDFNKAEQLRYFPGKYHRQVQGLTHRDSLQDKVKNLATSEAIKQLQQNAAITQAQQQVGRLLSKYREFANSSDLSTATKNTSMKGKSFREHLVIGGNFNVISSQPLSIDLSPQLGYKFTTKFFVGLGMNYRCTFGDSIRHAHFVSTSNTSVSGWTSYDVFRSFYAVAEWERSGITVSANDKANRQWTNNYFVGMGKRLLVHPKVYLTVSARYNLNNDNQNKVYTNRFQIRVGFQLSELAGKKNLIYYDPN